MEPTDLERDLAGVAEAVDWPPTPDVVGPVAHRITAAGRRRRPARRRRRGALAVVLVAVAAGAVVSPVRAAVGRLLGIAGGEQVQRVTAPPRPPARPDLGRPVSLEQAMADAGFRVAIPRGERIDDVRVGGDLGPRSVSIVLDGGTVLTQTRGQGATLVRKQVGPGVAVRPVRVGPSTGLWIARGPRAIVILGPGRRAVTWRAALPGAGVLLWDRDGVAMRLETRRTLHAALALARRTG